MAAGKRETEIVMKKTMTYSDANEFGMIAAGDVIKIGDLTASLLASSYSKHRYVTVHIDPMSFQRPIELRDIVIVKASINYVRSTSMEVGVRVEVQSAKTRKVDHVTSTYVVLVALDDNNKTVKLPPLTASSKDQKRRFEEGKKRMDERVKQLKGK